MKKIKEASPTYCCYICGGLITGEHVYIETRRGSKLHIHFGCMGSGGNKDGQDEQG